MADWSQQVGGKKMWRWRKYFLHLMTHSGQCENECLCAQHTHKTPMRSQWGKQLGIPYGWSQSQHLFPLSKSAPSSLNILCESASSSTNTPSPPHTGTRATCWWGSPKEPAPCQRLKPALTPEESEKHKLNFASRYLSSSSALKTRVSTVIPMMPLAHVKRGKH